MMKSPTVAISILGGLVFGHAAAVFGQGTVHEVTLSGIVFTPADLTIDVGDTVRWEWVDGFHNVESGVNGIHDGHFRSGDPTPVVGTTFEVVFDQAFLTANPKPNDAYPYYCLPHVALGMVGTITVTSATGPSPWAHDGDNIYNTNAGNVGIGTSTPVAKVEVVGSTIVFEPASYAVAGVTDTGFGVVGVSGASGWAGAFVGNVLVTGALVKGGGSFTIDHPLDPANAYLSHSFVESPDMMNVYNGNVTTDVKGLAWVALPEYFEALNKDYRYQLTVIGQFAQATVAREIQRNRFLIRTDRPGVKVSWQVTGVRQDPWANAHRIVVEEDKRAEERGSYLHPELYDEPAARGVHGKIVPVKEGASPTAGDGRDGRSRVGYR